TVAPGYAVDLRVDIPEVAGCDQTTADNTVAFTWTVGEKTGSSEVAPDDGFHMLDRLHDEGCLAVNVSAIAGLTAVSLTAPAVEPRGGARSRRTADLGRADRRRGHGHDRQDHQHDVADAGGIRRHRGAAAAAGRRGVRGRSPRHPGADRAEPLRPARARRGQD